MTAIYRKELGQLFHSFIGYIYLTIFLLISGGYFVLYNLLPADGNIGSFFSRLMSVVIFLLPMLTMRSYAEERKMKTMQLLTSAPVRAGSIAIGKFLAVLTIFALGLSVTLLYPVCLAFFGQFEPLLILGNYVGMLISASAFISIGLFISLLTENQIIACIVTYSCLLALWLIGFLETYITQPLLRLLVHHLSVSNRFSEYSMGIFDFSTMIYYLSITLFFLFLITVVTEKHRHG